jgi:uncharacterized protein (TIGR02391 family)
MRLSDLIPDAEVVCAFEPDDLGLRILAVLVDWQKQAGNPPPPAQLNNDMLNGPFGEYGQRKEEVALAIREAWAWLEGAALLIDDPRYRANYGAKTLSRRAKRLAEEPDPRRAFSARRLPKEVLHASIREDVWALYHRGEYDTAVFKAMKAVEVKVREAAGLGPDDIGTKLMGAAFNSETGILTDMDSPEAERKARAALFAGAIGSYKNPHSHRYVDLDDPDEAAEIIMLACHLLRIVDTRREALEETRPAPATE